MQTLRKLPTTKAKATIKKRLTKSNANSFHSKKGNAGLPGNPAYHLL